MDVAGSAVGIASLGIQVCQGLLSYYNSWRGYNEDITTAYDCIDDLCKTFKLLEETLGRQGLDPARSARAEHCLRDCANGLDKLEKKLQKLQTHPVPSGLRQKSLAKLQRLHYPFRQSTLVKIQEIGSDLRERLSLALQVLQLDLSTNSHHKQEQIGADVTATAANVRDLLTIKQVDEFRKIVDWLSPPDPWVNHRSARQHHEPDTGSWFLQLGLYQRWKDGRIRHLWLYGKAGCGKTVLSSTVIEDMQQYCENATNAALAVFYFSFSDKRKQSFENLLLSLITQLGGKGPGRSILQREYNNTSRSLPGPAELEEILISSIGQYDEVFLALDALDECPEGEEARQNMLDGLERLSEKTSNLKILATSRELGEIHDRMGSLGANPVPISTQPVDADIERYVRNEMSRDRKLSRLDGDLKTSIITTFAEKADGMFRWAYCQLQELKKLKSSKPKFMRAALLALPATLDGTYERMLTGIEEMLRGEALVLLRWLAYAQSPPSLGELAEATIIDLSDGGDVDLDNRGDIEDTLDILSGLVTLDDAEYDGRDGDNSKDEKPIVEDSNNSEDDEEPVLLDDDNSEDEESMVFDSDNSEYEEPKVLDPDDIGTGIAAHTRRIGENTKVRLAHFSVKEYLESKRILQGNAKDFYLEHAKEQGNLADSCLVYLAHYSRSDAKISTRDNLIAFPLLRYASRSWFYHSSLRQSANVGLEVDLLSSEGNKLDWLRLYQPDMLWGVAFEELEDVGSSLYYASVVGLERVVQMLFDRGADVNAQGGRYGNALQAASTEGHERVVTMLIERGADVNAQGGRYGNALQAASSKGDERVVTMLIERGADVNAQGGFYGNALQAASSEGHERVVTMLIEQGADVNAQGGIFKNALSAASFEGSERVVQILLEQGAREDQLDIALQLASTHDNQEVVTILTERGADINAPGGRKYRRALDAALAENDTDDTDDTDDSNV